MELVVFIGVAVLVLAGLLAVISIAGATGRRRVAQAQREVRGLAECRFDRGRLQAIHVASPTSLQFELRPEDENTREMRASGRLVEIQAGDIAFDANVFVECDDTRVADWLRRDAEARKLIATLVGGNRSVAQRRGRLALAIAEFPEQPGALAELARLLRGLAERVPGVEGADPRTAPQRSRLRTVRVMASIALCLGFAAAAVAWADVILHPFPQHVRLWPLLLGAGLLGLLPATFAYRRALHAVRETSHAARLASELFVSIWLPIAGITVFVVHQANLRIVAGPEYARETEVLDLYQTRHRRSTSHHFVLPALDDGRIPSANYDSTGWINGRLRAGQPVRVRFRDGVLASTLLLRPPEPIAGK